jgi:hypothetical protein
MASAAPLLVFISAVLSFAGLAAASDGVSAVLAAVEAAEEKQPQDDAVQPEIVVPGGWLTDNAAKFLFLPLEVPKDLGKNCKIMSNGDSILVVVTERPEEEPETNAMKEYRLVMEAIKTETRNDERKLEFKLKSWLETEEDEEVRAHVQAAFDSLTRVRNAKKNVNPRVVSVPLGLIESNATAGHTSNSSEIDDHRPYHYHERGVPPQGLPRRLLAHLPEQDEDESVDLPRAVRAAPRSRSLLLRHKGRRGGHGHIARARAHAQTRIIKESFSVVIPYAAPVEEIFVLSPEPGLLMVGMPLQKHSLDAKGISTGGKPFVRVPVFGAHGERLWGEGPANLARIAKGLNLHSLTAPNGLKPLE